MLLLVKKMKREQAVDDMVTEGHVVPSPINSQQFSLQDV